MKKKILITLMAVSLLCPPPSWSQSRSLTPLTGSLNSSATKIYHDAINHLQIQKEQHFNGMKAVLGYGLMSENALKFFEKTIQKKQDQKEDPSQTTLSHDDPTRISSPSHLLDQESPHVETSSYLIENKKNQEEEEQIKEVQLNIRDLVNEQSALENLYLSIDSQKQKILEIIEKAKEAQAPSSSLSHNTYAEAQKKIAENTKQDDEISVSTDALKLLLKQTENSQEALNNAKKDFDEFSLQKDALSALDDTNVKIDKKQKEVEEDLKHAQEKHAQNLKDLTELFHNFRAIKKVSFLIEKDPLKNDLQDPTKLIENVQHTIHLVHNHQDFQKAMNKLKDIFEKDENMKGRINALVNTLGAAFLESDLEKALGTIEGNEVGFSKMKTLLSSCLSQKSPSLSEFCSQHKNTIQENIKNLENLEQSQKEQEKIKENIKNMIEGIKKHTEWKIFLESPFETKLLSAIVNFMNPNFIHSNAQKISLPEPMVLEVKQLEIIRKIYYEIQEQIKGKVENSDLQQDLMRAISSFNESDVEKNFENIRKVHDIINQYMLTRHEEIQNLETQIQSHLQSSHTSSASSQGGRPSKNTISPPIPQFLPTQHAIKPLSITIEDPSSHLPEHLNSELQKRRQASEDAIETYRQIQESASQRVQEITQESDHQNAQISDHFQNIQHAKKQLQAEKQSQDERNKLIMQTEESKDRGTTSSTGTNYSSAPNVTDLEDNDDENSDSSRATYERENDDFYGIEEGFHFKEQGAEPFFQEASQNATSSQLSSHDAKEHEDSGTIDWKNAELHFEEKHNRENDLEKKAIELDNESNQLMQITEAYQNFIETAKDSLKMNNQDSFKTINQKEENIKKEFDHLTKILGVSQEQFSPEKAKAPDHMPSTEPTDSAKNKHRLSSELPKPQDRHRSQSLPSRSSPPFHPSYSNKDYEEAMASLKRIGAMVDHMNQSLRSTLEKHPSKLHGGKKVIKQDASTLPSPDHSAKPVSSLTGQTAYEQAMESLDRMSHTIQSMITSLTAQTRTLLPSHKSPFAKTDHPKKKSPQNHDPKKDRPLENIATQVSPASVEKNEVSAKTMSNKDLPEKGPLNPPNP